MSDEYNFLLNACRGSFLAYGVASDRFFQILPHHVKIAHALERIERGTLKRLILLMPPRSWKTRMVNDFIPWYLWKHPTRDIIYTGHSMGLLQGFSRNIRDRIQEPLYMDIFGVSIREDNSAVNNWRVKSGGEFSIFGTWGGITWKGFDLWIIDDPYSWREDAESDTMRRKIYDWYISSFYSRRQTENSAIILIMQRWREDDLVWQILAEDTQNEWEVIKVQAIDEESNSFWPAKFSFEELIKIRRQMGEYFFQSQYQQDPVNKSGGDFKNEDFLYFDFFDMKELSIYWYIDPAISERQTADYTAIVMIWVHKKSHDILVLDYIQKRMLPNEIIDQVFSMVNTWHPIKMGIEVVQYQKMLALELKNQMRFKNNYFTLEEIMPRWEKQARIRSILQPRYSNRTVFHKRGMVEIEEELLKFPHGKHDDIIDALSGAVSLSKVNTITDTHENIHFSFFNRKTGAIETIRPNNHNNDSNILSRYTQ